MRNVLLLNSHLTPAYSICFSLSNSDFNVLTTCEKWIRNSYIPSIYENLVETLDLPKKSWLTGNKNPEEDFQVLIYFEKIKKICSNYLVNILYINSDIDIYNLSYFKKSFEDLGIVVICPDKNTFFSSTHKFKSIELALNYGLNCPKTFLFDSQKKEKYYELLKKNPLIIKAEYSNSSQYVWKVSNSIEFDKVISRLHLLDRQAVIQEYIDGSEEYTYHLLTNNLGEVVFEFKIKKNNFLTPSWSTDIVLLRNDSLMEKCKKLVSSFKEAGFWVIQTKLDKKSNKIFFIELNTRFGNNSRILFEMFNNSLPKCLILLNKNQSVVSIKQIKKRGISIVDNNLSIKNKTSKMNSLHKLLFLFKYKLFLFFSFPAKDIYHKNRESDKLYVSWYYNLLKKIDPHEI